MERGACVTQNSPPAHLPSFRWRRPAIALLGVLAILLALLAMHVFTGSNMSAQVASESMAAHSVTGMASSMSDGAPVPADDCGGLCGAGQEMLGMVCALAILATIVLLTLNVTRVRWEELRRIVAAIAAKAEALAPPAPPSLYVLSINRT